MDFKESLDNMEIADEITGGKGEFETFTIKNQERKAELAVMTEKMAESASDEDIKAAIIELEKRRRVIYEKEKKR